MSPLYLFPQLNVQQRLLCKRCLKAIRAVVTRAVLLIAVFGWDVLDLDKQCCECLFLIEPEYLLRDERRTVRRWGFTSVRKMQLHEARSPKSELVPVNVYDRSCVLCTICTQAMHMFSVLLKRNKITTELWPVSCCLTGGVIGVDGYTVIQRSTNEVMVSDPALCGVEWY